MEDVNQRAINWIVSEDTGVSSKVIWAVMMGTDLTGLSLSTPSDVSDFGRCFRLLNIIPEWEARLDELKKVDYGYHLMNDNTEHRNLWSKFVDNYEEMKMLYLEGHLTGHPELYKLMKEIL